MHESLAQDTPPEVRALLIAGWRAMTPAKKAELVNAWSADLFELAKAGIRMRHPDASAEEIRSLLGELLYTTLPALHVKQAPTRLGS